MDYLGKGEVLTNKDLDRFVNKRNRPFVEIYKNCISLSSAHKKGGKNKSVVFIIVFSVHT